MDNEADGVGAGDYINAHDEHVINFLQQYFRFAHKQELSREAALEKMHLANMLLLVSHGPYVCSNCRGVEHAK